MFKQLVNEAVIMIRISVDTPVSIQSGTENVLNPTLPDNQVMRQYRNGDMHVVLPGSSIKGVLRSRAETLLRSQGYRIDDPMEWKRYDGDGAERYAQSCPVSKIFGSLNLKSRIEIEDAYPVDPKSVVTNVRMGVGINRVTGGANNRALFDKEVVEEGIFSTNIKLVNFELWQLALVLWLLKDFDAGFIKLGSSTSRGLGKVHVDVENVKVRQYRKTTTPSPIIGFFDDDKTTEAVDWQPDFFGSTFEQDGFDAWIGEEGILREVEWPQK